jgi:hypothetical protein
VPPPAFGAHKPGTVIPETFTQNPVTVCLLRTLNLKKSPIGRFLPREPPSRPQIVVLRRKITQNPQKQQAFRQGAKPYQKKKKESSGFAQRFEKRLNF